MSALALLARGENKFVKLGEHDTVILSSHAIPGNESNVNRVMDGLLKAGAEVVHSGVQDVHATGHAQADEIKTYLSIAQPGVVRAGPRRVPPPDGQRRASASVMGVPRDHVIVCEDGDVLEVTDRGVELAGRVPAGYLYVDGIVGDVGSGVLRDRRVLASEGVVVVVVTVDTPDRQGARRPGDHHPRLGVRARGRGPARRGVRHDRRRRRGGAVGRACATSRRSSATCAGPPGKFVNERTRRRPMIVPVVMEA